MPYTAARTVCARGQPPAHLPDRAEPRRTVCIPGLGDPAAIEHHHAAARQLLHASGHALASRYLTTAVPDTQC
jgi:hypothetical protein